MDQQESNVPLEVPKEHPPVVHQHHFHLHSRGLFRIIAPPTLLAASVAAVVKTEGRYDQINWLVPLFGILCIWTNI